MSDRDDVNLNRALGRMEGKLDALLKAHAETDRRADRLEQRVSSLERARAYMLGLTAAASGFVTLAINFLIGKSP